jgi:GT2 family glycosyltransferase
MLDYPRVAVVVPVYNKIALTVRFLKSFRKVRYPNYTVIVVDDGSQDGTSDVLKTQFPDVVVLPGNGDLWWSGATNLGVKYALKHGYEFVLTINNDSRVTADFLTRLVRTAQAHPRSIVGCRINLLDEPSRVWGAGGRMDWSSGVVLQLICAGLPEKEVLAMAPSPWRVAALPGCGALVPTQCYREVGLYDAKNFPQYHGDSEFTFRAGAHGYSVLVDLHAVVYNDARNTSPVKSGWRYFFSKRSPGYWRPVMVIHAQYCPPQYRFSSLWHQYPRRKLGGMRLVATVLLFQCLARRKAKRLIGSVLAASKSVFGNRTPRRNAAPFCRPDAGGALQPPHRASYSRVR